MKMVTADGRGYGAKRPVPVAQQPVERSARPRVWMVISYVLLAVGGWLGLHRLYNRMPVIAFAQALFSVYVMIEFGTMVSLFLGILLVAWLIADAFSIPKWLAEQSAATAR